MATSTESIGPLIARPLESGRSPAVAGPWTRWITPSFADLFFAALIAWLFICGASGWKALLGDGDVGWHIRAGEYILAQHSVPTHDLFSFSKPDAPWYAWEWLSDVIDAVLYRWGGLKGVVLFAGALIGAYATLLLRFALWRGANALVASITTLLAVGASSMHFLARPHLFTLLFLPASLWLLEADRRKRTSWLWMLVPLAALWTNLHGGFAIFLACVAVAAAGTAIENWSSGDRWGGPRRYATLFAACSAATVLNPYGIGLHRHILEYLRADWIRNLVQEFQAPTFRSEGQLQYEGLLLAGLILTGFLLRRGRIVEALWIVFLAHSSLISVRHAPLYAAVAAPILAAEISTAWGTWSAGMKQSSVPRILYQLGVDRTPGFRRSSLWPLIFVCALAMIDAPIQWPKDFPSEAFPVDMVHKHADLVASGRLLTTDQWGDYILYSFYPRQRVFVDGRSDFYGLELGQEYVHLMQGAYDWKAILRRYQFDRALLPVEWPLASLLKTDPEWRLIDDDHHSLLFRRVGR